MTHMYGFIDMAAHTRAIMKEMKTTVNIDDSLLTAVKSLAREEQTTLRALIEEGLRGVLRTREGPRKPFRLKDCTFRGGSGMRPEVAAGGWPAIRAIIYEGRGG